MGWSVIVHGGAGQIDDRRAGAHIDGCTRALMAAQRVLEQDGAAIDAACAAVRVLEDDPEFNAGTGSALDENGVVTNDAAIMRGDDLAYGAIGAVAGVKNPIDLARAILEDG